MAQRRTSWREDFRDFIMKGNLVELAVAIIIGIAFGAVVLAFVNGIVMPLIAAIVGKPNFDALVWTVGDGRILYGTFLTALVNFLVIAGVLFLMMKAVARLRKPTVVDVTTPTETELLTQIRDLLAQRTSVR